MALTVAAFYRFTPLDDLAALRSLIADECRGAGIRGTILLASEGINGTIAGPRDGIESVLDRLSTSCAIAREAVRLSQADKWPFARLRVRVRPEIITMRSKEADPTVRVGRYVEAADWNAMIADPQVVVVDTRNAYETSLGSFEGAIDPAISSFTDFKAFVDDRLDPAVHRRVAMFCTGGIRCEKASAYMLSKGFQDVVHLKGGILRYLEAIPHEESLWRGDCYVFDGRVAVGHGLLPTDWTACCGCGHPLLPDDRLHESFEEGVSCRHCRGRLTRGKAAGLRERQRQMSAPGRT